MNLNDTDLSRDEIDFLIEQYIFNETDRKILKRRLLDGICYEQLSEEFFLSEHRIKMRVYKAQDKLFKKIEKFSKPYWHQTKNVYNTNVMFFMWCSFQVFLFLSFFTSHKKRHVSFQRVFFCFLYQIRNQKATFS